MFTIDPDVLTFDHERDLSVETFAVTGEFDQHAVVAALDGAANRFMLVDEAGGVHRDFAAMQAAGVISAASYVSDAEVTERGVEVYIDCQGGIEDDVSVALRAILAETLAGLAGEGRVVGVVEDF